ncbi:hypothetical protein D3C78_1874500 [compost metagenome]
MMIGSYVSGFITESYSTTIDDETSYQWQQVWLVPACIAGFVLLTFAVLFKDKLKSTESTN